MESIVRIGSIGVAVVFLASCGDRQESFLSIDRDVRVVRSSPHIHDELEGWTELDEGLYRARFVVPPTFLNTYPSSAAAADPFADPEPVVEQRKTAQEILENAGITFGPGTSATYSAKKGILTVVQTRDQMELVEAYTYGGCYTPMRQLHIRAEIYQLPSFAGVEVLDSIRSQGEHSPERDAVYAAAREGRAALVAAPAIIARSGQRAKTEEVISVPAPEPGESEEDDEGEREEARTEIPILSFEVDPVLGADEYTVDLNLHLEMRDREDPDFSHVITTQVTKHHNDWILLGNWNVVESGEMILVFVTASLQTVGDTGELIEETEE